MKTSARRVVDNLCSKLGSALFALKKIGKYYSLGDKNRTWFAIQKLLRFRITVYRVVQVVT